MRIKWIEKAQFEVINSFDETTEIIEDDEIAEIVGDDDIDMEIVEPGELDDVDITEDKGHAVDMQFASGGVAFNVPKTWYEEVR